MLLRATLRAQHGFPMWCSLAHSRRAVCGFIGAGSFGDWDVVSTTGHYVARRAFSSAPTRGGAARLQPSATLAPTFTSGTGRSGRLLDTPMSLHSRRYACVLQLWGCGGSTVLTLPS